MRILFVADGRSPIAINWIKYFLDQNHEVHLVSTIACSPELPLASLNVVPVAFSQMKSGNGTGQRAEKKGILWGASAVGLRTALRQWLGPLTLPGAASKLRSILERVRPDLIHAMRVPFEGMVAAIAVRGDYYECPLLVSVWGNDFTLHAPSSPLMVYATRRVLHTTTALHADCQRDLRLAQWWGYPDNKPSIVLPGGGGVQLDVFYPPQKLESEGVGSGQGVSPMVINPRGYRAYVRNDTFFRAIPMVLDSIPGVRFVCPAMGGEPQAQRWLNRLGIESFVELLPIVPRRQMAELFRQAQVAVSPTTHDGTPNTLLEAMACGCFPIAGDLESIREWISSGVNGLLISPFDPNALANAILKALVDSDLHRCAAEYNARLIAERADYSKVMREVERFYFQLIV